jgi:hypothetical protein
MRTAAVVTKKRKGKGIAKEITIIPSTIHWTQTIPDSWHETPGMKPLA